MKQWAVAAEVTFETVKAGLHCSFRISRHMLPLELMLGWYTFVAKLTCHQARNLCQFLLLCDQRCCAKCAFSVD